MEIYVHRKGSTERITADPSTKVAVLRGADGESVFLQDGDEPLAAGQSLSEAGVHDGTHVHVSACHRVGVKARYGGVDKTEPFAPSSTFAKVLKWATGKKGFALSDIEAAKHTLRLCGQPTEPDRADHIGRYVDAQCQLCLDLVPKERFEG